MADRFEELNAREQEFILRYEETLDPYKSAIAAGYSVKNARACSYSWMRQPHLKPALYETAMARRAKRLEAHHVSAEELKHRTWLIATADPAELCRVEARCCRHCHGVDFGYQWKEHEFEKALQEAELGYHWNDKGKKVPINSLPDYAGGFGFDQTQDPHPDCPHCRGEGRKVTIVTDTRDLSEAGRALFKGTKVDRNGNIEVIMHDQHAARVFYAQLCGYQIDRKELTGANGSPLATLPTTITLVAQTGPVDE
jgi:phage terminase small subunit